MVAIFWTGDYRVEFSACGGISVNGSLSSEKSERPLVVLNWRKHCRVHHGSLNFCLCLASRSDDDPKTCQGLAHLLEHICANIYDRIYDHPTNCVTYRFYTVYSFTVQLNTLANALLIWSTLLLREKSLRDAWNDFRANGEDDLEAIMKTEIQRVDNEFYMQRHTPLNFAREIEMLRSQGTDISKFRWGTAQTLEALPFDDRLVEMEKLRTLCRQRPLNVYIYSADVMNEVQQRRTKLSIFCWSLMILL